MKEIIKRNKYFSLFSFVVSRASSSRCHRRRKRLLFGTCFLPGCERRHDGGKTYDNKHTLPWWPRTFPRTLYHTDSWGRSREVNRLCVTDQGCSSSRLKLRSQCNSLIFSQSPTTTAATTTMSTRRSLRLRRVEAIELNDYALPPIPVPSFLPVPAGERFVFLLHCYLYPDVPPPHDASPSRTYNVTIKSLPVELIADQR